MVLTGVELMPYSSVDGDKWNSSNPVGSAMDFSSFLDTSTVICTEYNYNEMFWTFSTVESYDHMGHFVSGHRQFGITSNNDGSYSFYLRGADRLSTSLDQAGNDKNPLGEYWLFKEAADATWKNVMTNIEKFIKAKAGSQVKPFDNNRDNYARRYTYHQGECK